MLRSLFAQAVCVEQLAEDLSRHLADLPVLARQPSWPYRGRKFVRRHSAGVVAASLMLLTVIAGVAATTRQTLVARAEKARAERRFSDVRKLANSVLFEVHDAIQDLRGSTAARQLIVKRSLEYLDGLATEASGDRGLQLELATAYQRLGDVQGNPNTANSGDTPAALSSYRKALAIREIVVAAEPTNTQAHVDLGVTYERIGDILRRTKGPGAALESYERNRTINERLSAADPGNARIRRNLSVIHNKIGRVAESTGALASAQDHYQQALVIAEALAAQDHASVTARNDLAIPYDEIGDVLVKRGDLEGALNSYQKKRAIIEDLVAANPQNPALRRSLFVSYVKIPQFSPRSRRPIFERAIPPGPSRRRNRRSPCCPPIRRASLRRVCAANSAPRLPGDIGSNVPRASEPRYWSTDALPMPGGMTTPGSWK